MRVLRSCCGVLALLLAVGCGETRTPERDEHDEQKGAPVRIMPLGDSITESAEGHASYRYWLWKALEERGLASDFVGGSRGVHGGAPRFQDFDADHEGHWGWTTAQVRSHIDEWAARSTPDVVLLLLGTNDGARDLPVTLANLRAIIESLRAARSGVSVLVGMLPPVGDPQSGALWQDVEVVNRALPAFVEQMQRPDAPVVLVDLWSGIDVRQDTWDGIHMNESGERKLAARWLDALLVLDPWGATH